ncbi:MAG: hypothetical protein PHN82_06300 [bacterium]|nr:hypothetical protein [bacterium]
MFVECLSILTAAALAAAAPRPSATATPVPAAAIDLDRFTVSGVGLESTAGQILEALGRPQEIQTISAALEEKDLSEDDIPLEKRPPERMRGQVVYAYFNRGIRIVLEEGEGKVERIDCFIDPSPPYARLTGSFVQPIPIPVRHVDMLRPLARQIYKDRRTAFFLRKDDRAPLREAAVLSFSADGWLSRVTFRWEENLEIDLDGLGVAGLRLGDSPQRVLELLGPPDAYGVRGRAYAGTWQREGIRVVAGKRGAGVSRITVHMADFDGGFAQPLTLTARKDAFREHLGGRIYQEEMARICAYREGEPLSPGKLVLAFDEDDRLHMLRIERTENVRADFDRREIAGVGVGASAAEARRALGPFGKWRAVRRGFVLAFPRQGLRLTTARAGDDPAGRRDGKAAPRWGEIGPVRRIDAQIKDSRGLYGAPFSFADTMDDFRKKAGRRIFLEKGDALFLSEDGRPPDRGVAAVVTFDPAGWPTAVAFREFRDLPVDMKAFTVAGVGLGTHADEVQRLLGRPDRARAIARDNVAVFSYLDEGIMVVIERMGRTVCKIVIDMELFEGSFVQDLTADSNADEFEKALHAQIYKADEKNLWFTPDGARPTWEDGAVSFGLTGEVDRITFQTLAVKKDGLLREITRELD